MRYEKRKKTRITDIDVAIDRAKQRVETEGLVPCGPLTYTARRLIVLPAAELRAAEEYGPGLQYVGRFAARVGTRPIPSYSPDHTAHKYLIEAGAPISTVNEVVMKTRKPGGWKYNWPTFAYFAEPSFVSEHAEDTLKDALSYLGELPLQGDVSWNLRQAIREVGVNPDAYAGFFGSRHFSGKKGQAMIYGLTHVLDVYNRIVTSKQQLFATSVFEIGGRDKVVDDPDKPSRIVLMDDFVPTVIGAAVVKKIQRLFMASKKSPIYMGSSWQRCGYFRFLEDIDHEATVENDWSRFDTTVPEVVIRYAFAIISSCFAPKDGVEQREIDRTMTYLYANFVYSLVMIPGGYVYRKTRGIPSGSAFTSLVGGLCNWLMLRGALTTTMQPGWGAGEVGSVRLTVAGDDSTLSCRRCDVWRVRMALMNACVLYGVIQKPEALKITYRDERTTLDNSPTFLGYTFRYGYPERTDSKVIESAILYDYIQGREITPAMRWMRAKMMLQLSPMTLSERPWLRAYAQRVARDYGISDELSYAIVDTVVEDAIDVYLNAGSKKALFIPAKELIRRGRPVWKPVEVLLPRKLTPTQQDCWVSGRQFIKPKPANIGKRVRYIIGGR
jgi:hypothetical protein